MLANTPYMEYLGMLQYQAMTDFSQRSKKIDGTGYIWYEIITSLGPPRGTNLVSPIVK